MELNSYLSLVVLFVSFVSLPLFVLFYRHSSQFTTPNLPPGRMGYPIIGEILDFVSAGRRGCLEKFFFDRKNKYSSEVFKTSLLPGEPMVVLCGAACNKFLFSNENNHVTAWRADYFKKIFPFLGQEASVEAKKLRSVLHSFLMPETLQRYVGTMDSVAQRLLASLQENKVTEVTTFTLAKRYIFLLACRSFMGIEDENLLAKLEGPLNDVATGIISLPIDLPGTSFNTAIKAANFLRKELLKIIRQRKEDLGEGNGYPTQDLLSQMLLLCDEDGNYMNENEIADKIVGVMAAGFDPTGATCTFIVKYLAELPHIYDKVYQEHMEIAKSKSPEETLNWQDVKKMRYTWNVACEVMRILPPVPGAFREAIDDFTFNGFIIPKGWKLFWSSYGTHKSQEYFQEPEKFDPSRFERNAPAPHTFVPFGGGPRMCPGKEYARLEILVFMHNLVKLFKWKKLVPNEKITITSFPKLAKGLPIRLYPHKA